jgi:cytochrome c553
VELRDAEELKNSPDDCRQCHQRGLDRPALLMRELNGPWTHFFSREDEPAFPYPEPTGGDLMQDFLAAHGDESYAGLPSAVLRDTQPFSLRKFADVEQPLLFDALAIVNERWARDGSSYPSEPRRSATWDAAFNAFKRGEQLALPYFAPRATDPEKAQRLTAAYQRFAQEGAELPDLSDVFPDAAQTRAEIGLQVEPGATPAQALVQACGSCHNDVLDQTLSRARFNIALGRLDRAELDLAVVRLCAPAAEGGMPPRDARQLDEVARDALVEYLQRSERPMEDDAFLELAAQRGMSAAH